MVAAGLLTAKGAKALAHGGVGVVWTLRCDSERRHSVAQMAEALG